ncbi:hypothetical protein BpHYR1_024344 [Brachionus plicatilis]|uniref:Uncharacterized protein n=1 Tax=Brachionus plicatilis TaxID=10195 RepID=A0A3M7RZ56_BRAPC|nr:hypothetical protein BpHYR1_024344 [Brachionus plicatilis]
MRIFQLGAKRRLFFDEIKVRYDTPASFVKLLWACTFHEPIYRLHIADVVTWIERIGQEEILNYSSKSNVMIDSAKMTYKLRPQFENEIQLPNIKLLRILPAEKAKRAANYFSTIHFVVKFTYFKRY